MKSSWWRKIVLSITWLFQDYSSDNFMYVYTQHFTLVATKYNKHHHSPYYPEVPSTLVPWPWFTPSIINRQPPPCHYPPSRSWIPYPSRRDQYEIPSVLKVAPPPPTSWGGTPPPSKNFFNFSFSSRSSLINLSIGFSFTTALFLIFFARSAYLPKVEITRIS